MMHTTQNIQVKLENFDDVWGLLGDPVLVEKKFLEIAPQAQKLENKSIYLQILSQLALAQALLQKFDVAHATLDEAQAKITSDLQIAQARILLERGRVFQQAGDIAQAKNYFEQSYTFSIQHRLGAHAVNAAHMIAIVTDTLEDKIMWNQRAIDLATTTDDLQARRWLGSVWNNLAVNYLDAKQYEKALEAFTQSLEYRKHEGYAPNIRVAQFRVGQMLRLLGYVDQALSIQQQLIKEFDLLVIENKVDMPQEMFMLTRGFVLEELAELYVIIVKNYAQVAYKDLSSNQMFVKTESIRLQRLNQLQNI